MEIDAYIFRNYDIRGIVPDELDEKKVEAIGKAFGTFLRRRKIKQAVMGRDCRLSGESFQKAFTKGLAWIPAGHILRMSPPIIMPQEVAAKAMDIIEETISETQKALGY